MQWDESQNAGFAENDVVPWLPLADDYPARNVKQQSEVQNSELDLYRSLSRLRSSEPALSVGDYISIETGEPDVFVYRRSSPGSDDFLIALNFSSQPRLLDLSQISAVGDIVVSTKGPTKNNVQLDRLSLHPDEGLVIRL